MKHRSTRLALTASAAALALLLAACGAADAPDTERETTPDAAPQANDSDVEFAQGMIPHHGQALEMSELAAERTSNPDVLALAQQIEGAQEPEINLMSDWLTAWGKAVPEATGMDHAHMDHGEGSGMMTAEQMDQLAQARDSEFDQMFLEFMIEHHVGAIGMSERVLSEGQSAEVQELARQVITEQNEEIAHMRELLADA